MLRHCLTCALICFVYFAGAQTPAPQQADECSTATGELCGTIRVLAVEHPGNKPLHGDEILIKMFNGAFREVRSADENGLVVVSGLPPGDYEVMHLKTSATTYVQVDAGETEQLLLRTGQASLLGRVTQGGKSIDRAKVRLMFEAGGGVRETIADENGVYEIHDLPELPAIASVHELGFVYGGEGYRKASHFERIDLTSGSCEHSFKVPYAKLHARFVGDDGSTPTQLLVAFSARDKENSRDSLFQPGQDVFDYSGLAGGMYQVSGMDPVLGFGVTDNVFVPEDGETSEILVILRKGGATISLRALDTQGKTLRHTYNKLKKGAEIIPFTGVPGPNGESIYKHIQPGKYILSVWGGSEVENKDREIEIAGSESLSFEDVLRPAGEFVWELDSLSGQSLIGLQCTLEPLTESSGLRKYSATYSKNGDCTFNGVLPGRYIASVSTPDGKTLREEVSVSTGCPCGKHSVLP